jgi:hypothetical protein
VFTARYALSPYIKQIHSVFKGLIFFLAIPNKFYKIGGIKTDLINEKAQFAEFFPDSPNRNIS